MFRAFLQFCCVSLIAIGAGSFSYGRYLEPPLQPNDPAAYVRQFGYDAERTHREVSVAKAIGTGLLIFGTLGLVVPYVNALIAWGRSRESAAPASVIPVDAHGAEGAAPAAR